MPATPGARRGPVIEFVERMARRQWRFLQLTLFIAAWMVVAPLLLDRWITQLALQLILVNALYVTLSVNPGWQATRRIVIAVWLVSIAGSVVALLPVDEGIRHVARTAELLSALPLISVVCIGILTDAFRRSELTLDGIFATIAVYLLLAVMFSLVYMVILEWAPGSFNVPPERVAGPPQLLQSTILYYSMITLATVGYGDILPLSDLARTVATLEATVGQFYVAVIVAVFVGMYTSQRRR
jgi:Ion channel